MIFCEVKLPTFICFLCIDYHPNLPYGISGLVKIKVFMFFAILDKISNFGQPWNGKKWKFPHTVFVSAWNQPIYTNLSQSDWQFSEWSDFLMSPKMLIKGAAPAAVTKHLAASANCKANNFASSFSLIDNEANMQKRRIMEALYIRDIDPIINRQVKSYKLNLI